jgi:hypothetical protein
MYWICNSYCVSTATVVTRTRLNATWYVHCLSCNTPSWYQSASSVIIHSVCPPRDRVYILWPPVFCFVSVETDGVACQRPLFVWSGYLVTEYTRHVNLLSDRFFCISYSASNVLLDFTIPSLWRVNCWIMSHNFEVCRILWVLTWVHNWTVKMVWWPRCRIVIFIFTIWTTVHVARSFLI